MTTFNDAQAALAYHSENWQNVDLTMLDMAMPELSGKAVFHRLREHRPDAPILICSGYALNDSIQTLLEEHNTGFIQKPFRVSDLSQAVSGFFKTTQE